MLRVEGYLMMGFGAAISGGERREVSRAAEAIALARGVCRDPDAGAMGPAIARIDAILAAVERSFGDPDTDWMTLVGLLHYAVVIAATERL